MGKFWVCKSPTISHTTGQKYRDREIVTRRSKRPIRIFGAWLAKIGKKFWWETFGTIGVKVWSLPGQNFENLTYGRTSKGPSPGFGRTSVKSTNCSHAGQKDRFIVLGPEGPKMGKKSWRKTIGVKVRSEIFSPGQNFLFRPIWYDVPGWHSAVCRVPSLHFGC